MPRNTLKTPQIQSKTTRRHHARRSKTLQDAPKTSKDASKMAQDTCKTRPKTATNPSGYQNRNVLSVDSSLVLEAFLEPKTKPKLPPYLVTLNEREKSKKPPQITEKSDNGQPPNKRRPAPSISSLFNLSKYLLAASKKTNKSKSTTAKKPLKPAGPHSRHRKKNIGGCLLLVVCCWWLGSV